MTETASSGAAEAPLWSRRTVATGATALAIVALGDLLLYPHEPGINLALLGLALCAGIVALNPATLRSRMGIVAAVIALLGLLPSVEAATFTGFLWGLFGVSLLALAASGHLPRLYEQLPGVLVRFGVLAPVRLLGDGLALMGEAGQQKIGGKAIRLALVWLVPLAFAAVFAVLFVAANPLLEAGLRAIRLDAMLDLINPGRFVLWGLLAIVTWPLLAPKLLGWSRAAELQGPVLPKAEGLIFGASAIRNSLLLFNALFAVQSAMDLVYLWGGVRLPEGMTHADYAHRGAYPLIVTALLAAAFVLAAMRKGGAGENSALIRTLVYLWIGQNVLLVVSSILRLDLYVGEYMLTELRLAAGIWMALVAIGLVLILARIALRRSNAWLIAANLTTLGLTLYAVSIVDTRALIAWFNVQHAFEVTGMGQKLDRTYMADLGWPAMPALDYFLTHAREAGGEPFTDLRMMRDAQAELIVYPEDWQSWTWRHARQKQYVLAHPFAPEAGRDSL